jgi:hypothetical protein
MSGRIFKIKVRRIETNKASKAYRAHYSIQLATVYYDTGAVVASLFKNRPSV